jgi:GDP-D-mannose 3',5'-epimerase
MQQGKKTAYIGGGNGFIGHHMGRRLKKEGYFVRVVDIEPYKYGPIDFADEIIIADLRDRDLVRSTLRLQNKYSRNPKPFEDVRQFDEVYIFCCLMGGAGFVFTGDNDANIMHDSALMNLHFADELREQNFKGKLFYSSSACMYPQELQNSLDPDRYYDETIKIHNESYKYGLSEDMAYPASPDSEYGWEKLFSERLYLAYQRNYNLNVRIARFHNIYGPEGTYTGGKEKAPAAMCRKVVERIQSSVKTEMFINWMGERVSGLPSVEVWGDGLQTRSFLYIDDCIDAVRLLMESDFKEPINIGSEEMIAINDLAKMVIDISGKSIAIKNIPGPTGVRGRNSNNDLIRSTLGWEPKYSLRQGMELTYNWIKQQYEK